MKLESLHESIKPAEPTPPGDLNPKDRRELLKKKKRKLKPGEKDFTTRLKEYLKQNPKLNP